MIVPAISPAPRRLGLLADALRLAVWRAPRDPSARLSGFGMVALFAVLLLAIAAEELFEADGAWRSFSPYGVNGLFASAGLVAAVILAFARRDATQATARRLMLVNALLVALSLVEHATYHAFDLDAERPAGWSPTVIGLTAVWVLSYVWITGAARQAFRATPGVRRPALRGFAFVLALTAAALLPAPWPIFASDKFDERTANLWEYANALINASANAEAQKKAQEQWRKAEAAAVRLEASDHLTLSRALGKLAPRDPERANVFTIGVAGWSQQDVFRKEIEQSTAILRSHFNLGERSLHLINNSATAREAPMASIANLAEALRAVAHRMDRERDLLVLTLSSHGSPDGFALSYEHLIRRSLDPETLKLMLEAAGIKNRVLIVSSCYSGTFVAPLQDPDTMILTAAAADRTSFGCSDDRHWTWFGEAFFEKALADHATLTEAFAAARATIADWEREQKVTPSNPQIFVGEALARRFPDIIGVPPTTFGAAVDPAPPRSE